MTTIQVNVNNAPKPNHTVIRFNGHINWQGKSAGLPETIYAFVIVENADMSLINKVVEDQSNAFIRCQAMYVQRNQGKVIDCRINAQDRTLIPFHNISHITVDLVNMSGELSEPDENGVERLTDGTTPPVQ